MRLNNEQSEALRRHAESFDRSPAAELRRKVIVGLVGLGAFCAVAFIAFGTWGPAFATVWFGLFVSICLVVIRGVTGQSALYDATRRYVEVRRSVDWLVAVAAVAVFVLFLAIFELIGFAIWVFVAALGLAVVIHGALDRPVERQQRGPVREAQEILATLRRNGTDEHALQASAREQLAGVSREFFEALFGAGERVPADALALREPAAWWPLRVRWIERHTEARRSRKAPAVESSPRPVGDANVAARGRPQPPPAERPQPGPPRAPSGLDADAALRHAVERGLNDPSGPGAVSILLGPQIRFLVGALLVAGCLLWMSQNDMIPTSEIGDVSQRLVDRRPIDALDEVGSKIADRMDPADRQVQPLHVAPLPRVLTGWIDDYSAGLAGLMLILSSMFRGSRISWFAYPAAALAMFAVGWGLVPIWNIPEAYIGSAVGLALLAAGVCVHAVTAAAAAVGSLGKLDERRVSLRNARGEMLHNAPGRRGDRRVSALRGLRTILVSAMRTRASDVHLDPDRAGGWLRMRVDGVMVDVTQVSAGLFPRLINLVKVLCDLDITQHRVVQEGHFSAEVAGRSVDYRISLVPSTHGQNLVVRVLDAARVPRHTTDLQLPDPMLQQIQAHARRTSGMLLVCGPTGSGKTTTLYAVMRDIDVKHRNVITIEDPVEYQLDGVTQIPVQKSGGSGFSDLLRSTLRQDPDVILLGEIRDADTARTAMQAAMTGHLVLSTVHARDTASALVRLADLGVEANLLASSLSLILAQRLVRRLCRHCRSSRKPSADERTLMGDAGASAARIFQPRGCPRCFDTGYLGRRALFELLVVDNDMKRAFLETPTVTGLNAAIRHGSFTSLSQVGWQAVADGVTTIDEVRRIVSEG